MNDKEWMMSAVTLYMIPGTGADKRMFLPQLEALPDIVVPEWLPPSSKKEPVASYAKRLAATLDFSSPFLLGGVSLGGMIAQEMALTLKPLALILIATSASSASLPFLKRVLAKLTRGTPNSLVNLQLSLMAELTRHGELDHKERYAQMLKEMPPELLRWQSGASTEWQLTQPLSMPVFHIHGGKDTILPLAKVKEKNTKITVIEDGGHFINITHAERVNAFIKQCRNQISEPVFARAV